MDRAVLRSVIIGSVLVVSGVVAAQQAADANQVVRDIERNEFRFDDVHYKMKIKLVEGGSTTREIEFEVWAKGSDKMLIKITAPGEVAGTAILQLGPRTMYMYNPEDRSVRLIAASARAQGLLGTDYAAADASLMGISDGWTASLLESTAETHKIQVVPENDDVSPYSKIVIWYDRAREKATKMEYYLDGELAKTITRSDFVNENGYNDLTHVEVRNARADRVTDVRITDTEVNTGLADSLFTKRNLMLGD
ncbi:MAG: outer membrane lipoprotein-sorting protein [Deltaproteobacteria bacterium]|nr:outer membrane lipoprotein-sorting protein [Deltaproteobacteria bacterium]